MVILCRSERLLQQILSRHIQNKDTLWRHISSNWLRVCTAAYRNYQRQQSVAAVVKFLKLTESDHSGGEGEDEREDSKGNAGGEPYFSRVALVVLLPLPEFIGRELGRCGWYLR